MLFTVLTKFCSPHHKLILENFHNSKNRLLPNSSHSAFLSLSLRPLATPNLSTLIDLPIPDSSCKRNQLYSLWSSVTDFFHSFTFFPLMFSRFIQVVCIRLYYHVWLNNIPLWGYITFQSLPIQQLVDIWVVSIFWLFQIFAGSCYCLSFWL